MSKISARHQIVRTYYLSAYEWRGQDPKKIAYHTIEITFVVALYRKSFGVDLPTAGVAITASGFDANKENCCSILSAPWIPIHRMPESGPNNFRNTRNVCWDNSRVGDNIIPRTWLPDTSFFGVDNNFSIKGMQKAIVLPDPVLAMTTVSTPVNITGNDFRWTGVGFFLLTKNKQTLEIQYYDALKNGFSFLIYISWLTRNPIRTIPR